jgi:hypothetical protein
MGLMYQFTSDIEDFDHVAEHDTSITLRTYGLPPIFWGYLAACLLAIGSLTLAVWPSVMKIIKSKELIDLLIGYGLIFTVFSVSLIFITLFFYEKNITKDKNHLTLTHKLYFMPFRKTNIELRESNQFSVNNFMASANVAKISGDESLRGFQNKGYYQLFAFDKNDQEIVIDRSSRKIDLEKIMILLTNY